MVRGVEPGVLPPSAHRPRVRARVQGVLGGATDRQGDGERLHKEIAELSAQKLTGAAVALSFYKLLTQPIQERVHPAYNYWGRQDPTQGQERKVPLEEIAKQVGRPHHGRADPGQGLPKSPMPEAADRCRKFS